VQKWVLKIFERKGLKINEKEKKLRGKFFGKQTFGTKILRFFKNNMTKNLGKIRVTTGKNNHRSRDRALLPAGASA
jgi:hypothetical protein